MELKKHNTKTDIWKKKKIINLNQSYKREQKFERERERERENSKILGRKYGLNGRDDIEFRTKKKILGEEGSKYKKKNDERSVTEKSRVMRR